MFVSSKLKKRLAFCLFSAGSLLLAGCGTNAEGPAPSTTATALTGRVHGGQQAVSGAAISLYAAGSSGLGQGATNQLVQPVTTDNSGYFGITGDYTCPSSTTQVYLVARGGNPGLAPGTTNPALVLVAALGDCGKLTSSTFIDIDEVTTVAAAWALSQFTGTGALVGATGGNATGLRNAFGVADNLANTGNGMAPGSALPAGARVETGKINTLADVLANCVNSNGGSACTPLFSAATVGGVAPANVFDAALNVVRNPAANVAAVFNAASANAPFQPVLTKAPNDWTMSITYIGGGLLRPTALGVDGSGDLWVANYYGGVVTELLPNGTPASATGYADPVLNESWGLTIDPSNNVWVSNQEGDLGNNDAGSLSKFSPTGQVLSGSGISGGGLYYPYYVAADTDGTIWVADFGHSGATILNNDGTPYNGNPGYQSSALPLPLWVALDGAHNGWFAASNFAVRGTRTGQFDQFRCCQAAVAIELDPTGNVWVTDYAGSALVELNAAGTVLQTLKGVGGITYPEGLAIDSAGTVWVASFRGNVFSGFGTASGGAASPVRSPATGFGVDAGLGEPYSVAVDASGNLWLSNFANSTVTQVVGLAAPTKTPVVALPTAP